MLPILFKLGELIIYAYPIFIGMALATAYLQSEYYTKKFNLNLTKFNILFWGSTIFAWLGAKILFLVSTPKDQIKIFFNTNFWFGGGFVFFGGLIGIIIFMSLFHLFKKITLKELTLFIPGLTFAHAIGRIGCFLAGCCFGKICYLPWSVTMHTLKRHPVQLYESFSLIMLGLILTKLINKNKFKEVFIIYIGGYSIIRFILEYFRGDKVRGVYKILNFAISTSQIISLLLILISVSIFLITILKKRNLTKC